VNRSSSLCDTKHTNVAIVGAGPYGLSLAAHLRARGVAFRIFGTPMQTWRTRMPVGMCLKSEGFASSLSDPRGSFTLAHYSAERGLPYEAVGYPIPLATFIEYGLEFQRRLVPDLELTDIRLIEPESSGGFRLQTVSGEELHAQQVVIAAGITHFSYLPPELSGFPEERLTHSSAHSDMGAFRGRRVAVIGAGSSAVDVAALLTEGGADVHVLARRDSIEFHSPPAEPRSWIQRIRQPRSGLGLGWRSRLSTDAPRLFHALPQEVRLRVVKKHLGPAPGWFMRDKFVGRVKTYFGISMQPPEIKGDHIRLTARDRNGTVVSLDVDHVVAATGYRPSLQRLQFLDGSLRARLHAVEDAPILKTNFESSAAGLFFVGLASAYSFGPLTRFAYGADYTAHRLSRVLSSRGN
jgi:thioredoxin reductase